MELLVIIAGIMLLWKFSSSLNALATSAEVKSQVMAEGIIGDSVEQRAKQYKAFKDKLESDNLEIVSHDQMMSLYKVD